MMLSKLLIKSNPKRILVFSQTNIGDVVLTCPVMDILIRDFPNAKIDVVVGPKAVSLFEGNPYLRVKVFDKRASIKKKITWFLELYWTRYDCIVDLRRTGLALFLLPKYSTPLKGKSLGAHKKAMHLNRLRELYDFRLQIHNQYAIITTKEDEIFFEGGECIAVS